jgi:hypothetical protein
MAQGTETGTGRSAGGGRGEEPPIGGTGLDLPEQPHRQVRRKANSLYGSAVLIPVLAVGWFWLRLFWCWGNRLGSLGPILCQSALLPAAAVLVLGVVLVGLLVRDIHGTGRSVAPHLSARRRFVAGYRHLDRSHRKHVTWSSGLFLVAGLLFLLFLWLIPLRLF